MWPVGQSIALSSKGTRGPTSRATASSTRRDCAPEVVEVALPPRNLPPVIAGFTRKRSCSTDPVRLALTENAERYVNTDPRSRQHVARFALIALYTGTRASAICGAALQPTAGHGWFDLDRGIFYRRPAGRGETKKRQPPVPIPGSLLAHLRRWKRRGQRFAIEWNGQPVKAIEKAFANAVANAGLGPDVTPHILRHTAATWLMQASTDPVASRRLPWDDDLDAFRPIWAPPPRPLDRSTPCVLPPQDPPQIWGNRK